MKTPSEKYIELLETLIKEIDDIDNETQWQPTEPKWWVEMMETRRDARSKLDLLNPK